MKLRTHRYMWNLKYEEKYWQIEKIEMKTIKYLFQAL